MSEIWLSTITAAQNVRHELHQYPELGWQEERTANKIRELLQEWGISWRKCATTGTVATLGSANAETHIALRGDIDALPIDEQNELPYRSQHSGCMHACGHDGHTATLLATARWLKAHEHKLTKKVSLLFQPAEEGGHGAKKMIEDGALEGVDCIFGWHNWPAIDFGKLACPQGIVMCGNGTFTIDIEGIGGHASQPDLCRNPVLAASAIVLALQNITSQHLPPQTSAVLSTTSIEAPSGPTTIPEKAFIGGSIRVPNQATRALINKHIVNIANNIAANFGVTAKVNIQDRYNATINHAAPSQLMRDAWQNLFGADALNHNTPMPIMASEDFSYYLQEIPGAFALIGAGGDGERHHCHSAHYDFDDKLIPMVTKLYSSLTGIDTPKT